MKCSDLITAFLMDYVEGALPQETLSGFEHHLQGCVSCVAYLHTYRETIAMAAAAGTAPRVDVEDVPEDLIRAILLLRTA